MHTGYTTHLRQWSNAYRLYDAFEAVEQCIQAIPSWMIKDKLRQLAKVNIDGLSVGESSIAPITSVRNLGSWFDQNLSTIPHIDM